MVNAVFSFKDLERAIAPRAPMLFPPMSRFFKVALSFNAGDILTAPSSESSFM